MSIYLVIVALTLLLGAVLPQEGPKRKYYILIMAVIQGFVCGFRYQHLTGDLMKYQWQYANFSQYDWFSETIFQEGRNFGFNFLMKLSAQLFGNQFQTFLVITAVVGAIAVAVLVYRYSPAPWLSYLVWNCMGFYIFGFSAVKQALAMAFLMFAFIGVAERKLKLYLVMMAIAGAIHTPSLIFLPAYWVANQRLTLKMAAVYLLLGVLMYVYRAQVVDFFLEFYYEEDSLEIFSGEIGNRFVMILGFCLFGFVFKGFESRRFTQLFHLMVAAAILQMLSGFNNVFTRLTDYYFQFSILYLPMIFYNSRDGETVTTRLTAWLPFNRRSLRLLAGLLVVFVIWFYYTYNINITIASEVDNYLNFRFMWDVK